MRSAITIGRTENGWAAYFGDWHANVHAIDAVTGKLLWSIRADDHRAAADHWRANVGRHDPLRSCRIR